MDKRDEELYNDGINKVQIVKTDGTFNTERNEIMAYGYNLLLKSYNESIYIPRCNKGKHNFARDMEILTTATFGLCLIEFTGDMKYKQSVQFDVKDGSKIGENVYYDEDKIGITLGGNYD